MDVISHPQCLCCKTFFVCAFQCVKCKKKKNKTGNIELDSVVSLSYESQRVLSYFHIQTRSELRSVPDVKLWACPEVASSFRKKKLHRIIQNTTLLLLVLNKLQD